MESDAQLIETIGTIYEAGLEPSRWYDTVRCAVDFVGGERGMVGLTDAATGGADVSYLYRMDPVLMERWAREYDSEDPWADGMAGVAEGEVGRGSDLISYEALEANPVFREIAAPVGAYDTCWTAIASNRLRVGWLSVFQGRARGVFPRECVERMAVLGPHLVRAARIHTRFAELESRSRALEGALDDLSFGLLTCTADARVVTVNRRGEGLFARGGPLRLREHRLSARNTRDTRRLRALIAEASSTARGAGASGGGVVALRGPDTGERPLTATVAPLSPRLETPFPGSPGAATALVMVTQPDQTLHAPEGALGELYGLTPAEARLALAMARGDSIDEYAEQAQISVGTARWSLKNIFAKTDTRRQAALVSLVLRSLGPLTGLNQ